MSRITIASCDGHAGMPRAVFKEYFEHRYWPQVEELFEAESSLYADILEMTAFPPEVLELVDQERAIRSGGELGAWDAATRVREMDREGVAWELLYMGTPDGTTLVRSPFVSELSNAYDADLRHAGSRAYNRWLADHARDTGGRVAGAALSGPCLDMRAEVAELEWLAANGMKAVYAPGFNHDPAIPSLQDPAHYELFWSACEDLGLRLAFHVNWGVPQEGALFTMVAAYQELKQAGAEFTLMDLKRSLAATGKFHDSDMPPRRAVWQLMLSGTLDRHPRLGGVLTELRADWTPAFVAHLDERFARGELPLQRPPSEYWFEHFRLAPSFVHPVEMETREAIGVGQMMFGRDYPHPEGTWPNTWDWLRGALVDVPEAEVRAFLGGNAIEWFGLDAAALDAIAARIGPRPEDLLGAHVVADDLIAEFDRRGGYRKPVQAVDVEALDVLLDADLLTATL